MSVAGLTAGLKSAGSSLQSKVSNYRASQSSRASISTDLGDYTPDMPHIKEGWMGKKGGVGGQKMWKKRWFVLTSEALIYCAKQAAPVGPNVKGQVRLNDAYLVETSATKRELCFQLCTPDRTYYFEPLSTTDRTDWIKKLKSCLDKRLDTASVLRSGFLLKLGGKVGPLMSSKMIPSALKSPTKPGLQEEKSKAQLRDAQKTKWQKRFFVLRMGELAYYAQQRDIFPPEKRKGTISLRGSYIVSESNIDPTHPNAFELISGERSYTLDIGEEQGRNMFSNNGDERCATKGEWISSLLLANPTAVFGVPLKVACERSNNNNPKALVPAPLSMATQWLNKHALREEGLYRIPGSKAEVEKFIKKYDCGEPVTVPENYFGGNLASLVVQFIRRCPENLFTEQYAPVFEKIVDDHNSGVDSAKQLHMLKKLIAMLPPVNLATVRCLVDHLLQVAALSEENHMTIDKLSMCVYAKMAPTLGICMSKYDQLFADLDSNVGTETTDDVARLLQETEEREKRERMARQEREEREEMARLKKGSVSSPSGLTSNDDSDEEEDHAKGAKGSTQAASSGSRCECGSALEDFAVFCGDCGKSVAKPKVETKAAAEAKKTATATRRGLEFGELKCPSCGMAAEVGTSFCDQCGNKIPSLDATANSPKVQAQKREDSPAPRKVQLAAPSSPQTPTTTLKKSGSNANMGNKYPLSPFQPERDRVATLETINVPVQPPPETTSMLDALKAALPTKADKWADWVAKLKASGIETVGDLKALEPEKLSALDCPALLRSVLNRIRSGEPMPASRASDAAPLKCVCGETNVPGAAFCDKCGTKIQPSAAGPRFSFSVPSPQPAPSPVRGPTAASGGPLKSRNAPPPPPFSGGVSLQAAATPSPTTTAPTTVATTAAVTTSTATTAAATTTATTTATTPATTSNAPPLAVRGRVNSSFLSATATTAPTTTPSPTVGPNLANRPSPSRSINTAGWAGANSTSTTPSTTTATAATASTTPAATTTATPATTSSTAATSTTATAASTTATATNRPTISRANFTAPATTATTTTTATTAAASGGAVSQRLAAFSVSSGALKCGVCGEPHAAGAAFCDQCGSKVGGTSGPTSAGGPSPGVASRWGGGGAARTGPALTVSPNVATAGSNPPKSPLGGASNAPKSPMGGAVTSSPFAKPATTATTTTTTSSSTVRDSTTGLKSAATTTSATTRDSATAGTRPSISVNAASTIPRDSTTTSTSTSFSTFPRTPSASSAPSPISTGPKPVGTTTSTATSTPAASSYGARLTTTTPATTTTTSSTATSTINKSPAGPTVGRIAAANASGGTAPSAVGRNAAANASGTALAPRPSVAGIKCTCGHTPPPGDLFCDQCGNKLSATPSSSPTVGPAVRSPAVARRVQSPFL